MLYKGHQIVWRVKKMTQNQPAQPSQDDASLNDTRAAAFDAIIASEQKVEPGDWMPEGYRKSLVRMMSQHAHSEWVGTLIERGWLTRAPTLRRKAILLAKIQDEAGHALYLYSSTETLGVTREEM